MNSVIEKGGKPVGTVSHRRDGDYKKQSDGSWQKIIEPKEEGQQEESSLSPDKIKDIQELNNIDIEHYTKSGSSNKDKYKGLTDYQKETVVAFEKINDGREMNDISEAILKGQDLSDFSKEDIESYNKIKNYMDNTPPYQGSIVRLMRDDKGIFDFDTKEGDIMEFNRLTSFGEEGNDFRIRGGDLKLHIKNNIDGVSVKNLMEMKEEKEVMLPPGKYKIVKKESGGSFNHIFLEKV